MGDGRADGHSVRARPWHRGALVAALLAIFAMLTTGQAGGEGCQGGCTNEFQGDPGPPYGFAEFNNGRPDTIAFQFNVPKSVESFNVYRSDESGRETRITYRFAVGFFDKHVTYVDGAGNTHAGYPYRSCLYPGHTYTYRICSNVGNGGESCSCYTWIATVSRATGYPC
jgi:hypothetical protein